MRSTPLDEGSKILGFYLVNSSTVGPYSIKSVNISFNSVSIFQCCCHSLFYIPLKIAADFPGIVISETEVANCSS